MGTCGITPNPVAGKTSCTGDALSGSFTLPHDAVTWARAVEACLSLCATCDRCKHVSVSLVYRDCSWYSRCPAPRVDIPSFLSGQAIVGGGRSHQLGGRNHSGGRGERRCPAVSTDSRGGGGAARPSAGLERPHAGRLWVAMGVITAEGFDPAAHSSLLRHQSGGAASRQVAWQYVTSERRFLSDPRFVVVPCREEVAGATGAAGAGACEAEACGEASSSMMAADGEAGAVRPGVFAGLGPAGTRPGARSGGDVGNGTGRGGRGGSGGGLADGGGGSGGEADGGAWMRVCGGEPLPAIDAAGFPTAGLCRPASALAVSALLGGTTKSAPSSATLITSSCSMSSRLKISAPSSR